MKQLVYRECFASGMARGVANCRVEVSCNDIWVQGRSDVLGDVERGMGQSEKDGMVLSFRQFPCSCNKLEVVQKIERREDTFYILRAYGWTVLKEYVFTSNYLA